MKPNPGTSEARGAGCRCPVMDNRYGLGFYAAPDGVFMYSDLCELHAEEWDISEAWKQHEKNNYRKEEQWKS
jgi:hypothetical protein